MPKMVYSSIMLLTNGTINVQPISNSYQSRLETLVTHGTNIVKLASKIGTWVKLKRDKSRAIQFISLSYSLSIR